MTHYFLHLTTPQNNLILRNKVHRVISKDTVVSRDEFTILYIEATLIFLL